MVVGSWKNRMRVYSAETGKLEQDGHGHAGDVTCVAFDRDGTMLISGSTDGMVRIWDPKTGDLRSTLTGHRGPITSLAISPDGAAIASCSLDQSVRVWQTATPEEASRIQLDYQARGEEHIDHGNWKEAADDFSRALERLPAGTQDWRGAAYHLAFVLAYLGETEKYQALCRRTIRDFRQTTSVVVAEQTSKMCLFSDTVQDLSVRDQAAQLADFAADHVEAAIAREEATEDHLAPIQLAKGIAEYRRGNYAAALEWFQKSIRGMSLDMDWSKCLQVTNFLFAAMAAHQLGETERPRQWLAEADRLRGTLPTPYNNTDRLAADMVRREALALIQGNHH
jgi:tetratricopeptide (TPR) repeat protein